jgi:FMN phosphatase YigB (HAD superfamily)
VLKIIAFDFGHTLMNELLDQETPVEMRPVRLMPGVADALPKISVPFALWANTRTAREAEVRAWLKRARLGSLFRWVITSVDAGVRKPSPAFFQYALDRCDVGKDEVLFVGNQSNTDIAGAEACGIRTVWLSDEAYRSPDDEPCDARPTYIVPTLRELPALVAQLTGI